MAIKEVSMTESVPEETRVSPHKEKIQVLVDRRGKRLGIAVRGKTTEGANGQHHDAGIYIRAICADGAAAQVGCCSSFWYSLIIAKCKYMYGNTCAIGIQQSSCICIHLCI